MRHASTTSLSETSWSSAPAALVEVAQGQHEARLVTVLFWLTRALITFLVIFRFT